MPEQREHELARQLSPPMIVEGYLKDALEPATATTTTVTPTTAEMYPFAEHEDPGNPDTWDYLGAPITVKNYDESLDVPAGHYLAVMWLGRSWRPFPVACSPTLFDLDAL